MFISHFKSLSGKARHQGLLTHDQEDSFTAEMGKRLPQRFPAPLAILLASVLVTICLLLWMVQNAITTCKSDSLVGGNSKRMTLTPLITLRRFGLSAGHFTLSHYAELFSETEKDALSAIESSLFLGLASATLCDIQGCSSCFLYENTKRIAGSSKPQAFFRKCAPASSLSSASCSLGNDIYSLLPLYNTMAILVITYASSSCPIP